MMTGNRSFRSVLYILLSVCVLTPSLLDCAHASSTTPTTPTNAVSPNKPSDITTTTPINNNNLIVVKNTLAKRFTITGPILTVTLKDPYADNGKKTTSPPPAPPITTENASNSDDDDDNSESSSNKKKNIFTRFLSQQLPYSNKQSPNSILGLSSLAPTLLWAIRSNSPPIPRYLPQLRATSVTAGYRYDDVANAPSFFEGNLKFNFFGGNTNRLVDGAGDVGVGGGSAGVDVDVSPSYGVRKDELGMVVRVGGRGDGGRRGTWFGLAKFANRRGGKVLQFVRGSYKFNLPFSTVGSLAITPTYDRQRDLTSCHVVGKSASGRTAAMLDLNWDNPTLSVLHALDERNTISPEISLNNAKIMYNWDVALNSGSIKTRVDPTSAIEVVWTDQTEGGKWVTDFRLPLTGGPGPLAGDIRVRRQFAF